MCRHSFLVEAICQHVQCCEHSFWREILHKESANFSTKRQLDIRNKVSGDRQTRICCVHSQHMTQLVAFTFKCVLTHVYVHKRVRFPSSLCECQNSLTPFQPAQGFTESASNTNVRMKRMQTIDLNTSNTVVPYGLSCLIHVPCSFVP